MLYYDFHIHSALSPCGDADMTPNNIVNMAALSGLNAIAISDHNSIGNAEAAIEVGNAIGVAVIPGMEVETEEGVHILTLYPGLDEAKFVADKVYEALPDIENRPEIFGDQAYMNSDDEIVRYERKLLISPANMSINTLFDLVLSANGLFIPAHVDRHSYSILTNLGFIPDDLDIKSIEISKGVEDVELYLQNREDLRKYNIFRNSDAHYLQDIAQKDAHIAVDDISELFRR